MSSTHEPSDFGGGGWQPPPGGPVQPGNDAAPSGTPDVAAGGVVGEVRGFQVTSEQDELDRQKMWTVWNFRVQRFDPAGNDLGQVAVAMRGRTFRGMVRDGDWVEVSGGTVRSGTIVVDRLRNLTTRSTVRALRWRIPLPVLIPLVLVSLVVLVVLVLTVWLIIPLLLRFPEPPQLPLGG